MMKWPGKMYNYHDSRHHQGLLKMIHNLCLLSLAITDSDAGSSLLLPDLTWPDLTSNGSSYHDDFSNNMLQLMMACAYRISCSYRSSEELNAKSPSPPENGLNWWRTLSASLAYRLRLRIDHDRGDVPQGGGGRFHMLKQELIYFFLQSCLGLYQFGIGWITHLI